MNSLNARIFAERLKLPLDGGSHVVYCPFHADSGTRSFSVDLSKGLFFCHGGCDEPKGGGALEFLIRWAKLIEKKTLTRAEAARMLRRTFVIPNAKMLMREYMLEELLLFKDIMQMSASTHVREIEHVIAQIHASCGGVAPEPKNWKWLGLEALYKRRTLFEWCFDVCMTVRHNTPTEDLVSVYRMAQERGWWSAADATVARALAERNKRHIRLSRMQRARKPAHVPRTPVMPTESERLCRAPQSRPTRQSISSKQPVPPLRQSVE